MIFLCFSCNPKGPEMVWYIPVSVIMFDLFQELNVACCSKLHLVGHVNIVLGSVSKTECKW